MEIISKISKGSKMDQVYIPKNRIGFNVGSYVVLKPLQEIEKTKKKTEKPFFYNIKEVEPIKLAIISEIFNEIEKNSENNENIIITGSFLDKGFNFNDVDIIIISENKTEKKQIREILERKTGISVHLISIDSKTMLKGLSTDPLYQTMISNCVSKNRFVYNVKREINYKILDLHLLKSKMLIENFDYLKGKEKYEMIRNTMSIDLFVKNKKVSKNNVDKEINKLFGKDMDKKIKDNTIVDKTEFFKKYRNLYNKLVSKVLIEIKNAPKQK